VREISAKFSVFHSLVHNKRLLLKGFLVEQGKREKKSKKI
jgi:hypothetical protein